MVHSTEYFNLNVAGFLLNRLMQERHMHDLRFKYEDTKSVNCVGIFTSLHQHGFSLFAMHAFTHWQNGHVFSLMLFVIEED